MRDWPLSRVGFDGVIAPATIGGFTVTVSLEEQADAGVFEESVTLYEYVVETVGEAE